jgi:predicted nucleic acid-binding protein
MLSDAVVDTNVFVHCQNQDVPCHAECMEFVLGLRESHVNLCVDEGFSMEQDKNKSLVGYEYLKHIRFGSVSYAVLIVILQQQRLRELPRRPTPAQSKLINQMIRNKHDRAFLGLAVNSTSRVLVSHDETDFQKPKRGAIKKKLCVKVLFSKEALLLLA